MSVPVRLGSVNDPSQVEAAWIENISNHGARVITMQRWKVSDRLVVASSGFRSTAAQVVYCQPLAEGRSAIGIKFSEPIFDSMISAAYKPEDT